MGTKDRGIVRMTEVEQRAFIGECAGSRPLSIATFAKDGTIGLIGMFYGLLEGNIAFLTKEKSQKVVNLRRDPRCTCMIDEYSELRGLTVVGRIEIVGHPRRVRALSIDFFGRRVRPYDEATCKEEIDRSVYNRVVLQLQAERTMSWDHRKLGAPGLRESEIAERRAQSKHS